MTQCLLVDPKLIGVRVGVGSVGRARARDLKIVASVLSQSLGILVERRPVIKLGPRFVERISRDGSLDGEQLLSLVFGHRGRNSWRMVGVLDYSLWSSRDEFAKHNFIYGYASAPYRVALVSTDLHKPVTSKIKKRCLRVLTLHEFGHTCGLGHHAGLECVMHDTSCHAQLEDVADSYCPACLAAVEKDLAKCLNSKLYYEQRCRVLILIKQKQHTEAHQLAQDLFLQSQRLGDFRLVELTKILVGLGQKT